MLNQDIAADLRARYQRGELTASGDPIPPSQWLGSPDPVKKIYVAASWRTLAQQGVVYTLRAARFEVYDFRNPPSGNGFHFSELGLNHDDPIPPGRYLEALAHPRSVEAFASDFGAMEWADTFVLVLPCGRSAHLELGWAVGAGKKTAVLLDDPCTPELMYKMVDHVSPSLFDLLGWLGVED